MKNVIFIIALAFTVLACGGASTSDSVDSTAVSIDSTAVVDSTSVDTTVVKEGGAPAVQVK